MTLYSLHEIRMFRIDWAKENMLLILIPPFPYLLYTITSRSFDIIYVACILFLLDGIALVVV